MRKFILGFLLLMIYENAITQGTVSFSRNEQFWDFYHISPSRFFGETEKGYWIVWATRDKPGGIPRTTYRYTTYDKFGNYIEQKSPEFKFYYPSINQLHKIEDDFLITVSGEYSMGDNSFATYMFDKNFKTIWEMPLDSGCSHVTKMDDSNYIGIGYVLTIKNDTLHWDYFLKKFNYYNGETKWKIMLKNIGLSDPQDSFDFRHISFLNNKIYVIARYWRSKKQLLLTFNSNGKLINTRSIPKFGTIYSFDDRILVGESTFVWNDSLSEYMTRQYIICYDLESFSEKWRFGSKDLSEGMDFYISNVVESSNKEISVLASTNEGFTYKRNEIFTLNNEGILLSAISYEYPLSSTTLHIDEHRIVNHNEYLMTAMLGTNQYDAYIIKTDSNGNCFNDSLHILKITGINKECSYQDVKIIKVFPNPAQETAIFEIGGQVKSQMNLLLYSINGKLVKQETITSNKYILERQNLPPGIYFYQITSKNQQFTGKLIFE